MKLSEKLEACAEEVASFPHPSACDHLHDAAGLLREAAALARRVEEAPVAQVCGECEHTWMRHIDTDTLEQDAALAAMIGKRVRIVEE